MLQISSPFIQNHLKKFTKSIIPENIHINTKTTQQKQPKKNSPRFGKEV